MSSSIFKLGDNINTDEIIPGRYNVSIEPDYLAKYCLCEICPEFPKKVKFGDVLIAGNNFGCGSSREHAPIALKAAGIKCVIAKSFARIFYRNAINIGLAILVCPDLYELVQEGDVIDVNLEQGLILYKNQEFKSQPLPKFILNIIEQGGIINFIKNAQAQKKPF